MASWSDRLPPLLVAAALLYVPGGLFAAAGRLPVRVAVALAPALSIALIAGTGVLAPRLGPTWGPAPVAGATVVAALTTMVITIAVARAAAVAARHVSGIPAALLRIPAAILNGGAPEERASPAGEPTPSGEPGPDERVSPPNPDERASPLGESDSDEPITRPGRPSVLDAAPALRGGAVARLRDRCWNAARGPLGDLVPWTVSAVLMATICVRFIDAPDAFSQTYDAVYHLNAVRWIIDTGNASSVDFDMVVSNGTVYPLGWHTLVVLTMRLSGVTSIPLATNAVMCAVAVLVWTSGIMMLTGALTADRRAGRLATAVLASAAPAFPLLGLFWGILYPTFLATALLPGLFLTALSSTGGGTPLPRRVVLWLMAGGACTGIAFAQPSILVIAAIAAVAAAAARTVRLAVVSVRTRRGVRRAAAACALTALLAAASWTIAPALRASMSASHWPPHTSVAGGIGEVATSAPELTAIVWPLALLVVIGYASAWRRPRLWWVAVTHTAVGALYVVTVSQDLSRMRYDLTGFWYSDAYRLGGFLMITGLPLAGIGACALADALAHALPGAARTVRTVTWVRATLTVVVVAVLTWQSQGGAAMSDNLRRFGLTFLVTDDSQSLTANELAIVSQLPELLDPDDVVLADPWMGGSLAYALTGVTTLPRHLTSYDATSPALEVLMDSLDDVSVDPEVCPALEELGVDYVLDFKGRTILDGPRAAGLSDIRPRDGFEPILMIGDSTLYHITACA